ncbi:unnamed protein product, partial [Adineta steineri]
APPSPWVASSTSIMDSKHRTVTTARVTIRKAIHGCCWHQG